MRLDGVRILVLDDEEILRDLMTIMLERAGASVVSCSCVHDALESLHAAVGGSSAMPDVVLSDIAMPEVDGMAFVEALRASPHPALREMLVLAITASSTAPERKRAETAGFDAVLAKPTPPGEIIMTISTFLNRRSGGEQGQPKSSSGLYERPRAETEERMVDGFVPMRMSADGAPSQRGAALAGDPPVAEEAEAAGDAAQTPPIRAAEE